MTVYNFSAGPGVLPATVLDQIQTEMKSFNGSQMSILEISHRSKQYEEMELEAEKDFRDLMNIDDSYAVLFLHGGGTLQFTNIALNLTDKYHHVAYVDSGHWAQKAMEAAQKKLMDYKLTELAVLTIIYQKFRHQMTIHLITST